MSDSFLNKTGLSYYHNKIKALFASKSEVESALDDKVDKVSGKGLSTNDYTTTEKNKLSGISTGAQVNVIESVKRNGTALTITNKAVDISVPTKLSDLTNDGNFVTDANYVHTDNNYTSTEKTKLSGIASGAQVNVIETIKKNGTALTVTSKAVDITVPTAISDLTNDGNFVADADYVHTDNNFTDDLLTKLNGIATEANKTIVDSSLSSSSTNPVQNKVINTALGNKANLASPTFTGTPAAPTAAVGTNTTQIATTEFVTTAVANAIGSVTSISYQVVQTLPATGENGVIYLVPHSHGTGDAYDEYVWVGSSFEKLGNTDIDLSGYMLKTDMVAITTAEIDTLFA